MQSSESVQGKIVDEEDGDYDDEDNNFEDWIEDEGKATKSLFSDEILPSATAAIEHMKVKDGFDLVRTCVKFDLDSYGYIRLVNYIRKTRPAPSSLQSLTASDSIFEDDSFLMPVVEDDPLLHLDIDELVASAPVSEQPMAERSEHQLAQAQRKIKELQDQLKDLGDSFSRYRRITSERAARDFDLQPGDLELQASTAVTPHGEKTTKAGDVDTNYFASYSSNQIHETMLKDAIRTNAYRDFILFDPSIFKNAVVLDVGCGSGILSMFAAKAGAKRVFAVDASSVADQAKRNIVENGLDHIITVIKGKIENLTLPVEQVDIIVSEWMGYFLLYESMLDSVLHARDRFLRPGGVMAPSQCDILLSAVEDQDFVDKHLTWWNDVYGKCFKMSAMADETFEEATIDVFGSSTVISDPIVLQSIHTQTVATSQLEFTSDFSLSISRSGDFHGFLGWFDTYFTSDGQHVKPIRGKDDDKVPVVFTTGPFGEPTHWKQTFFPLKKGVKVEKGSTIKGTFRCIKSVQNTRELSVDIRWQIVGAGVADSMGKDSEQWEVQIWNVR